MAFEVRYSAEAERNLDDILLWLMVERQAGETGLRWFQGLQTRVATLAEMPERCPLAAESSSLGLPVRLLLYGRRPRVYRILFTIDGEVVHILAIRRPYEEAPSMHGA